MCHVRSAAQIVDALQVACCQKEHLVCSSITLRGAANGFGAVTDVQTGFMPAKLLYSIFWILYGWNSNCRGNKIHSKRE